MFLLSAKGSIFQSPFHTSQIRIKHQQPCLHEQKHLPAHGRSRDTPQPPSSCHIHTGTWHNGTAYPNIPDETEGEEYRQNFKKNNKIKYSTMQ